MVHFVNTSISTPDATMTFASAMPCARRFDPTVAFGNPITLAARRAR